jgi:hypothetical protein
MANMFINYDNPTRPICEVPQPHCHHSLEGVRPIIDIKGRILGVQTRHTLPFTLYFHLENLNSMENTEIVSKLLKSKAIFKILTLNGKIALTQEVIIKNNLDQYTNDLIINISQDEAKKLKKEAYVMQLDLIIENASYRIYSEKDGYLLVR